MTHKTGNPVGRPPKMTESTLAKLKEAFLWGCSDREACLWAEISQDVLYDYQTAHPEYTEQKKIWKESPILRARRAVVETLDDNADLSLKFLERKKKDEFSLRSETDITSNGQALGAVINIITPNDNDSIQTNEEAI